MRHGTPVLFNKVTSDDNRRILRRLDFLHLTSRLLDEPPSARIYDNSAGYNMERFERNSDVTRICFCYFNSHDGPFHEL